MHEGRREKRETALYRILGIRKFQQFVFILEKWKHQRDGGRNSNYHLAQTTFTGLQKHYAFLTYNALIHITGLILGIVLIIVRILLAQRWEPIDWGIVIAIILNIYCIMLQRYNALRIRALQRQQQKIHLHRVEKNARLLASCHPIDADTPAAKDIQFLFDMREAVRERRDFFIREEDCRIFERLVRWALSANAFNLHSKKEKHFTETGPSNAEKEKNRLNTRLYNETEKRADQLQSMFGKESERLLLPYSIVTLGEKSERALSELFPVLSEETVLETVEAFLLANSLINANLGMDSPACQKSPTHSNRSGQLSGRGFGTPNNNKESRNTMTSKNCSVCRDRFDRFGMNLRHIQNLKHTIERVSSSDGFTLTIFFDWSILPLLAWIENYNSCRGILRVNLRGISKIIRIETRLGSHIWDYLRYYLEAFICLDRMAQRDLSDSYLEELAVCSCIIRQEKEKKYGIPYPMLLQTTSGIIRSEWMSDALYCEMKALEKMFSSIREEEFQKQKLILWREHFQEIQAWAMMPEMLYTKKGIPHMSFEYISETLERLNKGNESINPGSERPAGIFHQIFPVFRLTEQSRDYVRSANNLLKKRNVNDCICKGIQYIRIMGMNKKRVFQDNRLAVERLLYEIERKPEGESLPVGGRSHYLGYMPNR